MMMLKLSFQALVFNKMLKHKAAKDQDQESRWGNEKNEPNLNENLRKIEIEHCKKKQISEHGHMISSTSYFSYDTKTEF